MNAPLPEGVHAIPGATGVCAIGGGANGGSELDSQGKAGPLFGRLTTPLGPANHVVALSMKAVRLSALRQIRTPRVVRCSALPLMMSKRSSSVHCPTTCGIASCSVLNPSLNV